jgi:hypothetical protein
MQQSIKILIVSFYCAAIAGCSSFVSVQSKELYEATTPVSSDEVNGFKAVYIFRDEFDKSVWVSPDVQCVTMQSEGKVLYAGAKGLRVTWDKVKGGCKWIGIGFGWNNWAAKDMIDIVDECAVQMQVKAVHGSFSNFPVAFAFEDYGGVQAYCGFQKEQAAGIFTDSTWTSVTIPLTKFNFKQREFNSESVKQFLIQLEGDGDIYLDNIKIVRL